VTYPSGTGQVLWSCSKISKWSKYRERLAERTGLEPVTSCVTGSFSHFPQFNLCSILGYFRPSLRVVTTIFRSAIKCSRAPHKMKASGTRLVPKASIKFGELERPDSERLSKSIGQIRRNINLFSDVWVLGGPQINAWAPCSNQGTVRRRGLHVRFNFIFINCFQLGGFCGGSNYRDRFKMG